jgi:hypothetical protein
MTGNYDVLQQDRFLQDVSSIPSLLGYDGDHTSTDPFDFAPNSRDVNTITYLATARSLHVGTRGQDYAMLDQPLAISEDNQPTLIPVSPFGSAAIQPVTIGDAIVCVSRDRKRLIKITYDSRNNTFHQNDLNVLNDSISYDVVREVYDADESYQKDEDGDLLRYTGFSELAYDQGRQTIWCNASGRLVGLTINDDTQTTAWHQHILGGEFQGGETRINSLCMTPDFTLNQYVFGTESFYPRPDSASGAIDFLWLSTSRTINNVDFNMLEVIRGNVDREKIAATINAPFASNCYFDCAIEGAILANAPSGIIEMGLAPNGTMRVPGILDEATLSCIQDDLVKTDVQVVNRAITFDSSNERFQCGFSFTPIVKSFPLNAGGNNGTAHGAIKRIDRIRLHLFRTLGIAVGRDEDNADLVEFRIPSESMGSQTLLYSGSKNLDFTGDYEEDARVYIVQRNPLPFTLLGWTVRGATYD